MRSLRLSYDLTLDLPVPPDLPGPRLDHIRDLGRGDISNVYVLTVTNHCCTHVDAPRHFVPDGLSIAEFGLDDLTFERPVVCDIPLGDGELVQPAHLAPHAGRIVESDLLLIRTGFANWRERDPRRYQMLSPGFSAAGARYVRENFPELRGLGLDSLSLACMAQLEEGLEAHRVLLSGPGRRFLILEDIDLRPDLSRLRQVLVVPWQVRDWDSGPCTILAEVED